METYTAQDSRLNFFHMLSGVLLMIYWTRRTPHTVVLSRCGLPTIFNASFQCRLCWLGHVQQIIYGKIPKCIKYGELIVGKCNFERSQLHYRDVCSREKKELNTNLNKWKKLAMDCSRWSSYL